MAPMQLLGPRSFRGSPSSCLLATGSLCPMWEATDNMHVRPWERPLLEYKEYRWQKHLLIYVPPVLILLGTLGNVLSFIILMRRSMRGYSTYLYLAVLSITDTLVLIVGLLRMWVGELTGYDPRDHTNGMCKTINVIGYTISIYSVWLIVAVTVERYVAVCYPLKSLSLCNRKRACHVILSLFFIIFCLNIHLAWTAQVSSITIEGVDYYSCDGGKKYAFLVDVVWPWVDAALYSFLPSCVILVLNILIIYNVVSARRNRSGLQSANRKQSQEVGRASETSYRLTFMLLTISFAFLISTFPMNIALICTHFYTPSAMDERGMARFKLARAITELLMYVNHSMNFYLYCATGQKFRQQLLLLCGRRSASECDQSVSFNGHSGSIRGRPPRSPVNQTKSSIAEIQRGQYIQVKIQPPE